MNKTVNFNNLDIKPIDLDLDLSVDNLQNNVGGVFTAVPIYEVIMIIVILIMTSMYIQRLPQGFGLWKSLLMSSTLTFVFTFIMVYASLFSSYFELSLTAFVWLISMVMVIKTKN